MHRGYRRVLASAFTLTLADCFSPTGSVTSSTDSDPNTTAAPTTVTTTATGTITGTSDASQSTGTTAITDTTLTDTTASSDGTTVPGTTVTGTTGDEACGDGVIQGGEACDDGLANGPTRPCRSDCSLAMCGDANVCDQCKPAELCDDGNQVGDDGCDLTCQPTPCGDGILDAAEECDDNNQLAGDGCSARCLLERQYIFVSSIKGPGNSSIAAADLLCSGLAATKFNTRRKFVAWLSIAASPVSARIGASGFPYMMPSGTMIAADTADLLDGSLAVPIVEAQDGLAQPVSPACDGVSGVWTGTTPTGSVSRNNCSDWSTLEGEGLSGNFAFADTIWTQACNLPCAAALRVYCVETTL
ncbi:MAG: DUF4215 domain-containing protein [Nannocystis sp.]|nr:DUF4215 domain-containing protein [Nannocystis sp.]MBA3549793.1 DUF4215 domain-containing protein [Nannocystis sp.]